MRRTVLAVLFLGVFTPQLVLGATTFPWTVELFGGPYDGFMGSGSFTYDETELLVGDETLDPVTGSLEVSMTILGQTFTEVDDIDFDGFPELEFVDFEPAFINFIVAETGFAGQNPVEIDEPLVDRIVMIGSLSEDGLGGYSSFGEVFLVPEPAACVLCLAPLAVLGRRRRVA